MITADVKVRVTPIGRDTFIDVAPRAMCESRSPAVWIIELLKESVLVSVTRTLQRWRHRQTGLTFTVLHYGGRRLTVLRTERI